MGVLLSPVCAWATPVMPVEKAQQEGMLSRFYYQAALELASDQHMDMATDLIGRVYRMNRGNFTLAILYGQCLENQNRLKEAIQFYNQVMPHFVSPVAKSVLEYRISLNDEALNQTQDAIAALQEALRLFPGNPPPDYYFDLGVYYAKVNRYDQTKMYSQKAVDEAPDSAEAWNNLGYSLTQLGQIQEGYSAINKARELAPDNANILDSLGFVLYKMGRFHESVAEYEKALKLDPKMEESLLYLGRAYDALSEWGPAMQTYQEYLNLSTDAAEKANVEKRLSELKQRNLSGN